MGRYIKKAPLAHVKMRVSRGDIEYELEFHQEGSRREYRISARVSLSNITQIFTLVKMEVDIKSELESAGIFR